MAEQFDISPEKRRILEENAKRRTFLRNEFLKKTSDPFKHASQEAGTVFDPAMQRYAALKVSHFEFFKPTPKNAMTGLFFTIFPILGYAYYLHKSKTAEDQRYRNGEVAYKDRNFKLI